MSKPFDQGFNDTVALLNAGRLAEAEQAAAALIAAHPTAPAYNILGAIQAGRGDAAAAASFRKAIGLQATWDEPHANLGLALCGQNDFTQAVDSFRAALKLNPRNAAAALNLGNALRALGQYEDAAASYRQALALPGPLQGLAQNHLGAVLLDAGKLDDAVACFHRALALQPQLAAAHLNLGRALRAKGEVQASLSALQRAAELAPESSEARVVLANTLRDLGCLTQAAEVYRSALALKPGDREAGYNLGLALNDLGRHGEGLDAIARGPGIAHLAVTPQAIPLARADLARADMNRSAAPHFIGAWFLQDPSVCEQLIDFFETRNAAHTAGRTGYGLNAAIKDSTDLTVMPADLDQPGHEPVAAYLAQLQDCIGDYAAQWPHFGGMMKQVDLVPFTIQRYRPGGHFQHIHAERMSFGFIHRVLAWMTYLNDVEDGGETRSHHYGLDVRPERGKTLIWPAEWTHVHAGGVVKSGSKYIITGWMHFPHPKQQK